MLSPGDWATFFLHGGRVSSGVAERTLSLIKALDSAWKRLEPCDRELLHHTHFMPMLFRWLRHHKGGVTAARVSHGLGPGGADVGMMSLDNCDMNPESCRPPRPEPPLAQPDLAESDPAQPDLAEPDLGERSLDCMRCRSEDAQRQARQEAGGRPKATSPQLDDEAN